MIKLNSGIYRPSWIEVDMDAVALFERTKRKIASGWIYDADELTLRIKMAGSCSETYDVRIRGLDWGGYDRVRRERFDQPGVPPPAPEIFAAEKWGESVDVYFQSPKDAFSYIVE